MKTIDDLRYEVDQEVEQIVSTYTQVKPEQLGLDSRSASYLYVNSDYIVCANRHQRTLDYYGGFEYVDREFVFSMGDYTFYSREDSRVDDHLDTYFSNEHSE